jgi:hypothetical protein
MAGRGQIRDGNFRGKRLARGRSKPQEGGEEPDTDQIADSDWRKRERTGRLPAVFVWILRNHKVVSR